MREGIDSLLSLGHALRTECLWCHGMYYVQRLNGVAKVKALDWPNRELAQVHTKAITPWDFGRANGNCWIGLARSPGTAKN